MSARAGVAALLGRIAARPAAAFAALSLLFGAVAVALTPPLRGPDENAHFLRAFGIAGGEIVAARTDARGRRGLLLPPPIARDFALFDAARDKAGTAGFTYRTAWPEIAAQQRQAPAGEAPVFTLYAGSEGYSPFAYLPYIPAGALARLLGLDFLPTLYLMRIAGLVAATAVAAYAIALAPRLAWALVAIAMLPTATYGRSVVNADGAVLSTTLVVIVLCWRAALGLTGRTAGTGPVGRSVWMTLCALTKPPQVAFVLLEAMARRRAELRKRWLAAFFVALPAIVLGPLWVLAASGDIAAWRVYEGTSIPPEQFSPVWKLRFMLENPGHFPRLAFNSLDFAPQLWVQLIGVLGWLDTRLPGWVYGALTLVLVVVCCERPEGPNPDRARIAVVAGATALAYVLAVFLIFYLTYTPVDADRVLGLQGRYFVVVLPLLAIMVAGVLPRLSPPVLAAVAIGGALIGGLSIPEAILRTDWAAASTP